MRLFALPIRLLLAVLLGAMPLLCCCGVSAAKPAVPDEASHACCESDQSKPSREKRATHHDTDGCQCQADVRATHDVTADALPLASAGQLAAPCFFLAPLPRPLSAVLANVASHHTPPFDPAGLPAAPSLRSLSVLLLV